MNTKQQIFKFLNLYQKVYKLQLLKQCPHTSNYPIFSHLKYSIASRQLPIANKFPIYLIPPSTLTDNVK